MLIRNCIIICCYVITVAKTAAVITPKQESSVPPTSTTHSDDVAHTSTTNGRKLETYAGMPNTPTAHAANQPVYSYDTEEDELFVSNTSVFIIGELLKRKPDYMYINLNLVNELLQSKASRSLHQTHSVDLSSWTWAKKGTGDFLRSFPSEFSYFAMGAFDSSVFKAGLNVSIDSPRMFLGQNASAKLSKLSKSLINITLKAYDTFNLTREDFKVCQELTDHANSNTVWSFLRSLIYASSPEVHVFCWTSENGLGEVQQNFKQNIDVILSYYIAVIVGVLYFPMIILYISIDKMPPVLHRNEGHSEFRMSAISDLPLGIRYYLLIWGNQYPIIYFIRVMIGISVLLILADLKEIIVASKISSQTMSFTCLWFLIPLSASIFIFFYKREICEDDEFFIESHEMRKSLFGFPVLDKQPIPIAQETLPWGNKLYHCMKHRSLVAFDWDIIWKLPFKRAYEQGTIWCQRVVNLFRLITFIPFSSLLFVAYSPLFYILRWCWIACYRFASSKSLLSLRHLLKTLMLSIISVVFCLVVLILIPRFVLGTTGVVISYVKYTFCGVALNVERNLAPLFFIPFAIFGYFVSAVNHFNNSYRELLVIIVEEAEKCDKVENLERKMTLGATISSNLFWFIVGKFRPVLRETLYRILHFGVVAFITLTAFDLLTQLHLLKEISQSFSVISGVFLALVLPLLNGTLYWNEKSLRLEIKEALQEYQNRMKEAICETIKSEGLDEDEESRLDNIEMNMLQASHHKNSDTNGNDPALHSSNKDTQAEPFLAAENSD